MRRLLVLPLLLLSLAASTAVQALPPTEIPTVRFLIAGQSNASGYGRNLQTWLAPGSRSDHVAWLFSNADEWSLLADPTDGGPDVAPVAADATAYGSVWPLVAKTLLPVMKCDIAFIPCAKSGSSVSSWLVGDRNSRNYLYGNSKARGVAAGPVNLVLWWQGETDAKASPANPSVGVTGYTTYKKSLATLAARYKRDLGCDLMPCLLERVDDVTYPGQAEVNRAIADLWGAPNVVPGPDLRDIPCAPENAVHLVTDAKLAAAASRWAEAIATWYSAATAVPSPPSAPSDLAATPLSDRVVALAWTDTSTNESQFWIERKEGAAPFDQIARMAANETSYFDSAVAPSVTYTYRIRAANAGGTSGFSNLSSGATAARASNGVLRVRPTVARFPALAHGKSALVKVAVSNAGRGKLKVVVGQMAAPFEVQGTRTFTLKTRARRVLKVRYVAPADGEGGSTTLEVAGSGRNLPVVTVPVTAM